MSAKVAVVHYPHCPKAARLETMPFVLNSVMELINLGLTIDLYLWEEPNLNYKHLFSDKVRLIYSVEQDSHRYLNYLVRFQTKLSSAYQAIFSVGQIGVYLGGILARKNHCPLIYYNDEFPSTWPTCVWTRLESEAASRAAIIVVPDEQRIDPLCKELNLQKQRDRFSVLPNIPTITYSLKTINWHNRFNIPKQSRLFIHAGSIADWAQVPEILSTLPDWPEETSLILHSRQNNITEYRQELSHLSWPGKVVWSEAPLPEDELNSLIAYCSGSFGLYRNHGSNIETIGFSSGKIMRSIACSTPVIASNFTSLKFIKDHKLGCLVRHPTEISSAVSEIVLNQIQYRENCEHFCYKINFQSFWLAFLRKLELVGVTLC